MLIVTPNCVTRASRVTSTQAVSSYSKRSLAKWKNLKQGAIHHGPQGPVFLRPTDKIDL